MAVGAGALAAAALPAGARAAANPEAEILIWAQPFLRYVKEIPPSVTLVLGDENGGIATAQPNLHKLGWHAVPPDFRF